MTSKERVLKSIHHEQPDKVPIDLGSTAVTGIHAIAVAGLRQHFGLEKRLVKVHEPYQMLGLIDPDLQEALKVDVEGVIPRETMFGFPNQNWKPWKFPSGFEVLVSEHFQTMEEEGGSQVIFPKGDRSAPPSGRIPKNGFFFDAIIRQDPIDDEKLDPTENLEEFTHFSQEELEYFTNEAIKASKTQRAVIANYGGTALGDIALVPAPFLKYPKGIRDIEEWYMSTLIRQDFLHNIFDKQTEIAISNLEKLKEKISPLVDIIFICGTDFGTQNSTFCSVDTYRNLYLPYYKRMNDWIHRQTSWKTFKHSCGAIRPLISAFIESGFDIINPVQLSAKDMQAKELKEEFGKEIVFWGGGVDTQTTLAFAKPEDVRRQVLANLEIFSKDGGFIFNTVHNIQANTPLNNIIAMLNALNEFNGK